MKNKTGKIVLTVVIAGMFLSGIGFASAATRSEKFTGVDGKTVTLQSMGGRMGDHRKRESVTVTGKVTALTQPTTTTPAKGTQPAFGVGMETLTVQKTDGTIISVMINGNAVKNITVAVGDTVTIEGFTMTAPASSTAASMTVIKAEKFTGADGRTVVLHKDDGMSATWKKGSKAESVTISGKVTAVTQPAAATPPAKGACPEPGATREMIVIQQADGTSVTVVIGAARATTIKVAVGDGVTVIGFKMMTGAGSATTVVMAEKFTGADGRTVTLQGMGGAHGQGFRGGMMGHGSGTGSNGASGAPAPVNS